MNIKILFSFNPVAEVHYVHKGIFTRVLPKIDVFSELISQSQGQKTLGQFPSSLPFLVYFQLLIFPRLLFPVSLLVRQFLILLGSPPEFDYSL